MSRTINGHNKPRKPGEQKINFYSQTTSKLDEESRRSLEHAANTYSNRSKETIAKQEKAHQEKQIALARAKELENMIADEFNSDLIDRIVASFGEVGIEETLKRFKNDLKTFRLYSDEFAGLQKTIGNIRVISYYDDLLYRLAKKYPKFILYLPEACFTYSAHSALPLSELNLQELQILETKLSQTKLFSHPNFRTRYLKFFPNHILEMTDINDIAYTLKLNPSCFNKLSPTGAVRSGFYQNPQPLLTMVKSAPEILKYLTKEELYLFAKKFGSQLGSAINKCPSVLENFPETFFSKFNPKLVFVGVTKTNLKPLIEPYFARFPELQSYFASNKIKAKPVREPKPSYQFTPATDPTDF